MTEQKKITVVYIFMYSDLYMNILDCNVSMMAGPFQPGNKKIPRKRILLKAGVKTPALFSFVLVYCLGFAVAHSSKSTNRLYLTTSTCIC